MSRKKRIFKGMAPNGEGWVQVNNFSDKNNEIWSLWIRNDHNGYVQLKLVKRQPSKIKANYRLCYILSESRFVRCHEQEMILEKNPELVEPMFNTLFGLNFDEEEV